ncbi:hypothetical protein R4576_18140 [Acinetobacter baumannii]|nr:hypothetical protein [Acinetobacter baumannii]
MKNTGIILFSILFLGYLILRVYFYMVPIRNATIFLNDEHCGVAKIVDQNECKIHGEYRNDLFTNNIIIKADNGTEIYVNKSIISGIMRVK